MTRKSGTEYDELTNKIENLNKEVRYIKNFIKLHEFAITLLALWLALK